MRYEAPIWNAVKALPAKGYNWEALIAALKARYEAECAARRRVNLWTEYEAEIASGMRGKRTAVTALMVGFVAGAATRIHHQPLSEESVIWGETYGTTNVWTDKEAEEAGNAEMLALIKTFH